jgi:hypothetical protein
VTSRVNFSPLRRTLLNRISSFPCIYFCPFLKVIYLFQLPIQWVLGAQSPGVKRSGVRLTIHIHLSPRFRMSGAITSLPLYAFMACIGTNLPSTSLTVLTVYFSFLYYCIFSLFSLLFCIYFLPVLHVFCFVPSCALLFIYNTYFFWA